VKGVLTSFEGSNPSFSVGNGGNPVSPVGPLAEQTRLRAVWLRRAKLGCAGPAARPRGSFLPLHDFGGRVLKPSPLRVVRLGIRVCVPTSYPKGGRDVRSRPKLLRPGRFGALRAARA